MTSDRIARLSEGQRACLRMVHGHMSSKEIARELGISRHTVDQRVRLAMQTLQVANRIDAARLLAAHEGGDAYQPFVHQPPHVDRGPAANPDAASRTREAGDDDDRLRRALWIMAMAAAAAVFFGVLFIGLNALSDLTK